MSSPATLDFFGTWNSNLSIMVIWTNLNPVITSHWKMCKFNSVQMFQISAVSCKIDKYGSWENITQLQLFVTKSNYISLSSTGERSHETNWTNEITKKWRHLLLLQTHGIRSRCEIIVQLKKRFQFQRWLHRKKNEILKINQTGMRLKKCSRGQPSARMTQFNLPPVR